MGLLSRNKNKKSRKERSYGILLDGGSLIAVSVEDGQAIDYESIQGESPRAVLDAWFSKVNPRELVTVALVSSNEEFSEVDVSSETPESMLGVVLEERAARQFPKDRGSFSIASQIDNKTGTPMRKARVFGIPESEMENLWPLSGEQVRFTLPGMTFTVDGVHLILNRSAIEMLVVSGGTTVEAFVLTHQIPVSSSPDSINAEEQIATEAHMVLTDWARKQIIPAGLQKIFVTGPGATLQGIQQAFAGRGYQLQMDPISNLVDTRPLSAMDSNRGTPIIMAGIAAAAAVVPLLTTGILGRPGDTLATAKSKSKISGALSGKEATPGLKRMTKLFPIAALVIVIAGSTLPQFLGSMTLNSAKTAQATAQQSATKYSSQIATYNYVTGLKTAKVTVAQTVPWGTLLPAVLATAPSGLTITNMVITTTGAGIQFVCTVTASPASALPAWLTVLKDRGIANPTTTGFSVSTTGGASSTVTFTTAKDFH